METGIEMNGTQSCKFEKAYPWCLGVLNLSDTDFGDLTDCSFLGSSGLRSRSDLSTMSPCVDQIEDKVMVSECKRANPEHISNGIPMKMLIAKEMSKEVNSGNSSPTLIAKLMGLDNFPHQQPGTMNQRKLLGHHRCHSEISISDWEQKNGIIDDVEVHDYKDVHEIWSESPKPSKKDKSGEISKQLQMAFVRQKFIEAKRLSMDEKLRQSKQFQEALEVLNSNKELFLKCLQEPNSVLPQQLYNRQSIPSPIEARRITVLKPSKIAESNPAVAGAEGGKQVNKANVQLSCYEKRGSPPPAWKNYEGPAQTTRIVVLKPSSGNVHGETLVGFPQSESSRIHSEHPSVSVDDYEGLESRAVAKAITEQMRQKLRRNETVISSAFSNGYVADESSFNKSESECPAGNLTDSEFMSPVSRHSWDYVNRIGSPYSSTYSGVSYSPESSVCREAKKRLSERWAMMASNGNLQDQRVVHKTTSTLGEMLSLSEAKKSETPDGEVSSAEQDLKSLFMSESKPDEEYSGCSPHSLIRSKSVPVSSTPCETQLNPRSPVSDKGKTNSSQDSRTKSGGISSFRGKVSNLFFSRDKKTSKGKTPAMEALGDENGSSVEQGPDHVAPATSTGAVPKLETTSQETDVSVPRPSASGSTCKNLDLQSPVSVLDPPFEENEATPRSSIHPKSERHGFDRPFSSTGSNLIDKSPPIGSVARTLLWDDSYIETPSTYPIKDSISFLGRGEAEEEWSLFLKTLLSVTGLQGEVQPNMALLTRWHSPESPLDPSLRDKYIDLNEKGTMHEAKRRKKRSMQKLVFDCVNAALIDITGALGSNKIKQDKEFSNASSDDVFAWMNALFAPEIGSSWDECGDESSAAVERVVRKEVVGKGWSDKLRLEMDCLGVELGGKLVEELIEETVVELAGKQA